MQIGASLEYLLVVLNYRIVDPGLSPRTGCLSATAEAV